MNYLNKIKDTIQQLIPKNINITCEISKPLIDFGHIATNVGIRCPEIISIVKNELLNLDFVESVDVTNTNFINIKLKKNILKDIKFIKPEVFQGVKVNIEYCSPNPTGPLHGAHCRGTFTGNILANMYKYCGFDVTTEMIINDRGGQIERFYESVIYHIEVITRGSSDKELQYKGEYVRHLAEKFIKNNNLQPKIEELIHSQVDEFVETLKKIGVHHDVIFYETSLEPEIEETKKILMNSNLIYIGKPENAIDEGESYLINTEKLNLKVDIDKVFIRSNGIPTYIAYDIAYHLNKKNRGFNKQILVTGQDHNDHLQFLAGIMKVLNIDFNKCTVGYVTFFENDVELKMSKREGSFITLDEILKNIDAESLRVDMISKNNNTPIKIKKEDFQNNEFLFYLQYAYARICSIERKLEEWPAFRETNLDLLNTKIEDELFQMVLWWQETIVRSTLDLEPNKIFTFLLNTAKLVHRYLSECKILSFDDIMFARVILLGKVKNILFDSSKIIGITLKEQV